MDHPVIKAENKLKYFLNKYVKQHVDESVYRYIVPHGSQPGLLYGTAKVHKPDCPLRPVLATYGTAEYNLAKYLNKYITPVINNTYSVKKH